MKKLMTLIILSAIPVIMMAQSASIRHMLRKCDTGKEVTRIHLPPVLFRMASWFADDDDAKKVIRNIRSMYLVVSDDKEFSRESDFPTRVVHKLLDQNFEEMLVATDHGERVTILMREMSRNRKEMVIAVDGDDDVVIYLKGKLDLQEIIENEHINIGTVNLHDISHKGQ
jgi:hypothetical protein